MTATDDTFATDSGGGASDPGQLRRPPRPPAAPSASLSSPWTTAASYGSGDLTGDTFNMPVYVPYGDVQYLADNAKFQQIDINAATLPAGTLASTRSAPTRRASSTSSRAASRSRRGRR